MSWVQFFCLLLFPFFLLRWIPYYSKFLKKSPLYIHHSIFFVTKASGFLVPTIIPVFSSLHSEQFRCPTPRVSGVATVQSGNQGNVDIMMLQPCTIKNQVQHLVFSSAASLVWNVETNHLFGLVPPLHRWEWWRFSHCRGIWVTLGSGDLWLEVKLKYRSERSVSGRAGRISHYPFSSPNLGLFFLFQITANPQNLVTFSKEFMLKWLKLKPYTLLNYCPKVNHLDEGTLSTLRQ